MYFYHHRHHHHQCVYTQNAELIDTTIHGIVTNLIVCVCVSVYGWIMGGDLFLCLLILYTLYTYKSNTFFSAYHFHSFHATFVWLRMYVVFIFTIYFHLNFYTLLFLLYWICKHIMYNSLSIQAMYYYTIENTLHFVSIYKWATLRFGGGHVGYHSLSLGVLYPLFLSLLFRLQHTSTHFRTLYT